MNTNRGGGAAFTLVELIVVMTILAILSTIAFLSFTSFSSSARDTARKADVGNIQKGLDLHKVSKGIYPDPSDAHDIVLSGIPIWNQGVFGTGTQIELGKIFGNLKDPRFGNDYTYSITPSKSEYQIGVVYEKKGVTADKEIAGIQMMNVTHASDNPIAIYDAKVLTGDPSDLEFWYDGFDIDADGTVDTEDTSIANVGIVAEISAEDFSPFYFDRVIWLDGQDIHGDGNATSNPINGSAVTEWKNKTGAGFDGFVPMTGNNHGSPGYSTAPQYSENGFGTGKSGVYFNGESQGDRISIDRGSQINGDSFSIAYTFKINDRHNGSNYGSSESLGTSSATIMSVVATGGGGDYRQVGTWQLSRDGRTNNFIFRITGNILNRKYFNGANCNNNAGQDKCGSNGAFAEVAFGNWTEVNDNSDHTVFLTYEGDMVTGYLDGTKRFEATMSSATSPLSEYFRFFGNRAGSAYLEGILGEVFITGEKISLQDIEKIERYFANKWGFDLPPGHPYKGITAEMDRFSEILYTRFQGDGNAITNYDESKFFPTNPNILNTKTVRGPGSMPGVNIEENNKVHIWRGPIKVSETGNYTFETRSDDYSFVVIQDTSTNSSPVTVVNNGGAHSPKTVAGTILLEADKVYDFQLIYGEVSGGASLDYRVDGPGVIAYRKYEGYGWSDKSNKGVDLSQYVGEKQPEYNPVNYSFQFIPESYFEFNTDPYTGTDNGEVFVVIEVQEDEHIGSVGGNILENENSGLGEMKFGTSGMQAGSLPITGVNISGKQFQVVSYQFNQIKGEQRMFIGGQNYLQDISDLNSLNPNFILGGKSSGFSGEIREVVGYSKILTDEQRETIEGYLSHKWGIAHKLRADHEYYEPLETGEEIYVSVEGNYNGIFTHGNIGDHHIVVASPSIISSLPSSEGETVDFSSLIGDNRLVYNGYNNIPSSYSGVEEASEKLTIKNGFFFNFNNTKVFDGTRDTLASYAGISEIDQNLRLIYTNSHLHEDVASYFDQPDSTYVKKILGKIIGINPIIPYFCKDILDKSRGRNVALTSNIGGSSGMENSEGIDSLIDGETVTSDQHSYITNPGDTTEITLNWGAPINISFVRIHNSFATESRNLWNGKLEFYSSANTLLYEHTFGDTAGISLLEIPVDLPVGEKPTEMKLRSSSDYDTLALREIELFSGETAVSGVYKVDDDGVGGKQSYHVYCDMESDGGGWTKVGNNFASPGNFENQSPVDIYTNLYSLNNQIVAKSNPGTTPYVLRQFSSSTNSTIGYEMKLTDLSDAKKGRVLRLSARVLYDGGDTENINIFNRYVGYASGTEIEGEQKNIETKTVGGDTWYLKEVRIPLEDDVDTLYWRLGKGVEKSTTKQLYATDIKMELYFR